MGYSTCHICFLGINACQKSRLYTKKIQESCNERFQRGTARLGADPYELTAWVLWNTGTAAVGLVMGKAR